MIAHSKRIVASLLLICFSVFIVPNELIHALYDHEDSHHGIAFPHGKNVIDARHVHCAFLTYEGSSFTTHEFVAIPSPSISDLEFILAPATHAGFEKDPLCIFRGPPAV